MRSEKTPLELRAMWQVKHVADHLSCSMEFAYKLVKTPGCPLVILSPKAYRVPREAFLRWVEEQPGIRQMTQARALEHARSQPAEMPCVWEKRGNGSTPRALARTPGRD